MTASNSFDPLVRRWYILIGGLLLTAGIALGTALAVPAAYEAQATVLLVPGRDSIPASGNPFLYLGDLGQARDVVVRTLDAEATRAMVQGDQPGADYSVAGDPNSSAPLISMVALGDTPLGVQQTREAMLNTLPKVVSEIQERAATPENARFTSLIISADSPVTANRKAQVRLIVAAVVLGTLVTLFATVGVDVLLRRGTVGFAPRQESGIPLPLPDAHQANEISDDRARLSRSQVQG
jgi:hypothetical protein